MFEFFVIVLFWFVGCFFFFILLMWILHSMNYTVLVLFYPVLLQFLAFNLNFRVLIYFIGFQQISQNNFISMLFIKNAFFTILQHISLRLWGIFLIVEDFLPSSYCFKRCRLFTVILRGFYKYS